MTEAPDFFKKIRIFQGFSVLEEQAVLEFLKPFFLEKDQILFRQGEPGTTLYIIKRGVIGGYIEMQNNKCMEVGRFSAGQSFGEMAIIEALPRTMTCYAVTDAYLLVMEAIDFFRFAWEHPMIGVKMLKTMTCNMILWMYESNNFLNTLVRWGENARLRAITDELTELYNRTYLDESVEFAIAKYKQERKKFSFLMFDIDYFHKVNTLWGTEGGDALLKAIAQVVKKAFRENAVLAKLGGDEFAALLTNCPAVKAIERARQFFTILKESASELEVGNKPLNIEITMSIGIAEYPTHGRSSAALQDAADKALYQAKEAGRNTVKVVKLEKKH